MNRNGNRPSANPHLDHRLVLRLRHWLPYRVQTMTAAEIGEYIGLLFAAWSLGFASGYLLTNFKRGLDSL